jgi:Fe2+ transport system protein FeoA
MADGSNPFSQYAPIPPSRGVKTNYVSTIEGPTDNQGRPLLPLVHRLEGSGDQAVSPAGAIGRNQIMPATAHGYGFYGDLSDPAYNDQVAAAILTDLNQKYHGDTQAILIGYNSTPQRVSRFLASGRDPDVLLPETQKYLQHANEILHGTGSENPFTQFVPQAAVPAVNPFAQFAAAPGAENPFAQFAPTTPAKPGGTGGFANAVDRLWGETLGNIEKSAAPIVQGAGQLLDKYGQVMAGAAGATGLQYDPTTGAAVPIPDAMRPGLSAVAEQKTPLVTPLTKPAAAALAAEADKTIPANPSLVEKGVGMAAGFAPFAVSGAAGFAASNYADTYNDAIAHGASPEAADRAATMSGAIGGIAGLAPVGGPGAALIEKLGLGGIAKYGAESLNAGVSNAALMAGIQAGTNTVAQQSYDPARSWSQGVPEAALVGGLGGGAIHALTGAGGAALGAARTALTPRADVATGMPEAMPATTALSDYIGPPPEAPNAYRGSPEPAAQPTAGIEPLPSMYAHDSPQALPAGIGGVAPEPAPVAAGPAPVAAVEPPAAPVRPTEPPIGVDPAAHEMLTGVHPSAIASAAADVDEWKAAAPRGYSLFQAMKDLGGIAVKDENGVAYGGADVSAALADVRRPGLINNKTGLSPEYMMQALSDRGWFGPEGSTDPTDLENLLDKEAHGSKVYHPEADTAAQQVRREQLDHDMAMAGVLRTDRPEVAAAKLARYRMDEQAAAAPEGQALALRAEELGIPHDVVTPQDELLADVLEREAIQGEATPEDRDAYRRSINLQLTDADRSALEALAREGPGSGSYEGAPAESLPEGWESEPHVPEAYREPAAGPELPGEDGSAAPANAGRQLTTERMNLGGETVDQGVMPGMEPSARQAAAARDGPLRARAPQEEPGGIFAQAEPNPFAMFDPDHDPNKPMFQRAGSPVFYSAAERVVDQSPMKAAPPEQWKATLKNAAGVKREELDWSGVNDWLDLFGKDEKVPKEKVAAFLRDNGVKVEEKVLGKPTLDRASAFYGPKVARVLERAQDPVLELENDGDAYRELMAKHPALAEDEDWARTVVDSVAPGWERGTQFEDWKLPGGSGYKELLLTLPAEADPPATHWDTPGVMAHVRFDERTAPDGKKVLFVQEIQSDWHQKGRDQGYANKATPEEQAAALAAFNQAHADARASGERLLVLQREAQAAAPKAAPFSQIPFGGHDADSSEYWLRDADRSHELTGDLSDRVKAALREREAARLRVNEATQRYERAHGEGGIPDAPFKSSWPALVMKRVIRWAAENGADRVAWTTGDQQAERYSLEDGAGMRAFYDRNLVNITNDVIKKYGAKVEPKKVPTADMDAAARFVASDRGALIAAEGRRDHASTAETRPILEAAAERARANFEQSSAKLEEKLQGTDQPGFEITDKMREAAMGGFPLFNRPKDERAPEQPRTHPLVDAIRAATPDARQQALIDHVDAVLRKLAPFAESHAFARIVDRSADEPVEAHGMSYRDGLRRIVGWSLEAPDAVHTARHEAIHALRSAGVITDDEWTTLASAALSEGWLGRYDIDRRYGDLGMQARIEEAVAERFGDWRRNEGPSWLPPAIATVFRRVQLVLDRIGDGLRRVFGKDATAADVFSRIESGEVGARPLGSARDGVRFQRPDEAAPAERTRGLVNRLLGSGTESLGRKLVTKANAAIPDPVAELLDAAKMGTTPMGMGSERAQATAKDFANSLRAAAFQWGKVDEWLSKTFTPEQLQRMWTAADEHGVILRQGREPGENEGKNTLAPDERAAVEELQSRADQAFARAQALGMVQGDGLESYVPRMVVEMTAAGPKVVSRATPRQVERGANLSTTTGQLRQRKYETVGETEKAAKAAFGDGATVVRNIRTLALGTQRLEQAIAGRTLVDKIKAMSKDAGGGELVSEGVNPDPAQYFTIEHAAMQTWGPKMITDAATEKTVPAVDQNGDMVFEAKPLFVSREFEGPLKAVLTTPSGGITRALMDMKAKMMSVIMYSPLMHNAVIWGKALPADPKGVLTFGAYLRGNAARKDPSQMNEAIQAGLDPIGHRFFNQDLAGIAAAEGQDITPGRSWTAQMLAYFPGLLDKEMGEDVKRAVDKFGDVWHNTFLWDRIADLQMGLYTHIRDNLIAHGEDAGNAQRVAAHFANRYAGTLPMEGLSKLSRTTANLLLFSRSFTLGNAAIFKDVAMGLPSDVRAQIVRDAGRTGLDNIQGVARQKAAGMLAMDIVLSYVGLTLAAGATAFLTGSKFQAPWNNEPGKERRFLIGYQPDGTAIYGRLPTGKVGEELWDWPTDFRDTLLRKLSPYARLMYAMAANDKGFGQKMFDPYDKTPTGFARNIGRVMLFAAGGIAPESQLQAGSDMVTGASDRKTAALSAIGPLLGLTISKGAPGGPAMADLYSVKDEQQFRFQEARADIVKQIKAGDIPGARARMTALGVAPGLQSYYVKTALFPAARMSKRAVSDFIRAATPEQRARFEQDRQAGEARQGP